MSITTVFAKLGQFRKYSSHLLLPLLTLMYIVGELGHFLIGVVSRSVAQSIKYGEQSCLVVQTSTEVVTSESHWEICKEPSTEVSCSLAHVIAEGGNGTESFEPCEWNYNGLGTDYQLLAGPSFMACFTTAGIIWGIVGDRVNRVYLLGIATIGCGLAISGTAFATQYWHLVLCRMALAAGAAACTPLAAGMIGDVYNENKRALAMGIFNSGIFIGFGGSFAIGSYVKDTSFFKESWRTCFFISGIPALVIAVLFMLMVKEPRDGKGGKTEPEENIEIKESNETPREISVKAGERNTRALLSVFIQPVVLVLLVTACIRHSAGYVWGYNSGLYFQTYYPHYDSGWGLFAVPIVGGVIGCILGGHLSDRLIKRLGASSRILVLAVSQLLSTPFTVAIFYLHPPYSFIPLIFGFLTSEMWFGVMYATMVELVPANFRSTAVAMALFIINNVGGIMPVLVGPLKQAVGDYRTAIVLMDPGALFTSSMGFFLCWGLLRQRQ